MATSHASIFKRSPNKYPFPKQQEKNKLSFYSGRRLENLGTDPSTSPLQTERSTIWAKPPVLENLGEKSANDKCFLITADLTRKPEKILRLSVSKQN